MKAGHFLFSGGFELASDAAMVSRWGLKCARVYTRQYFVNCPLFLSKKASLMAAEVRLDT